MQAPQLNPYFLHSEPQSGWSSSQNVGDDGFGNLRHLLCIVLQNALMSATTLRTSHGMVTECRHCMACLHAELLHCTALKGMMLVFSQALP